MTATPTALLGLVSTTPGDMLRHGASEWVAFPKGVDGDVLTVVGGVPDWATPAPGGASPLTTKGDLYTYSTLDARLGVGADGYVLTADSAAATGLVWAAPGGIADGDKGDIVVSGSGGTWTIDAGAVTLAKMADVATGTFLGRNTAGTGVPEALTAAQAKALLSLDNVENTALSTWAGSTAIVTLGTITTGTVPVARVSGLGTLATVNDAPSDGNTYGRNNGAWAVAGGGSGLTQPQVLTRQSFGGF